jgi:hypothetical protein
MNLTWNETRTDPFMTPLQNAIMAEGNAIKTHRQPKWHILHFRFRISVRPLRMKARWIFLVSLALAISAFFIQSVSSGDYIDASKQQTQDFLHNVKTPDLSTDALLEKSKMLSYFALPVAAISAFCLFLSYRRKESITFGWRFGVAVVLALYFYLVIGPI